MLPQCDIFEIPQLQDLRNSLKVADQAAKEKHHLIFQRFQAEAKSSQHDNLANLSWLFNSLQSMAAEFEAEEKRNYYMQVSTSEKSRRV